MKEEKEIKQGKVDLQCNYCETGCCFTLHMTTENSGQKLDNEILSAILGKFALNIAEGRFEIPYAEGTAEKTPTLN